MNFNLAVCVAIAVIIGIMVMFKSPTKSHQSTEVSSLDNLTRPCLFLTGPEITAFIKSHSFRHYLATITPLVLTQKTKGNSYHSQLQPLTVPEAGWITNCVRLIPTNPIIPVRFPWKFIRTTDKLEEGMPYTLGDTIFLPPGLTTPQSMPEYRVAHTLAHEWMHLLQRRYPKFHRSFIIRHMKFNEVSVVGDWNLGKYHLYSNPDGLQTKDRSWIFTVDNKWYLPLLLSSVSSADTSGQISLSKKSVVVIPEVSVGPITRVSSSGKLVDNIHTTLADRFHSCPHHNLYHPHEILAELGADYLMESTCGSILFDRFFQRLGRLISRDK